MPAALSLTSATFRSYLFPSIFYSFLFPSAHPYFSLPSHPLPSWSLSILSASEFTTKACLLALRPPFCCPALLSLCVLFILLLRASVSTLNLFLFSFFCSDSVLSGIVLHSAQTSSLLFLSFRSFTWQRVGDTS